MKALILYSSKYGGTKACASRIAALLPYEKDIVSLDDGTPPALDGYDTVIIGGSVYMGKPRKPVRKYCQANLDALLEKRVGLFLCCIQDMEKNVLEQFSLTYPKKLMEHAASMEQLGGTVDFTKLKPLDKVIMNMVAGDLRKKTGGDVISTVSDERILKFVAPLR